MQVLYTVSVSGGLFRRPLSLASSIPSGSYPLSASSSMGFCEPWGQGFDGDNTVWGWVFTLSVWLRVSAFLLLLQEEASLVTAEQGTRFCFPGWSNFIYLILQIQAIFMKCLLCPLYPSQARVPETRTKREFSLHLLQDMHLICTYPRVSICGLNSSILSCSSKHCQSLTFVFSLLPSSFKM